MSNSSASLEAAKAAPPLGVGGLTLFGVPLNDVVLLLTAVYTVFLIIKTAPAVIAVLRDWFNKAKERYGRK